VRDRYCGIEISEGYKKRGASLTLAGLQGETGLISTEALRCQLYKRCFSSGSWS
jgi:hypothetical protein